MTNAEKYEEIFGLKPDYDSCPTVFCDDCPIHNKEFDHLGCSSSMRAVWWDAEYKEK